MKKLFYLLLLPCVFTAKAQNLVPNPSFEDRISCPNSYSQVPFVSDPAVSVTGWTKPTEASSDYFHTCATGFASFMSVPANFAGYQHARTGDGYTGTYVFLGASPTYKEYLQAQLNTPLVAGHHYHVSYWISLSEWDNPSYATPIGGVDRMGAYFGSLPEERVGVTDAMDDLTPQVESPAGLIFTDTTQWVNISGVFTAAGGETWMILGNFLPPDSLSKQALTGSINNMRAYYYYDDVCVLDLDGPANAVETHDTILCNGDNLVFSGREGAMNYFWDDGSTSRDRTITNPGIYWVKSVDPENCTVFADSFHVTIRNISHPLLGGDTIVCGDRPLTLDAYDPEYIAYSWSTGATTPSIQVSEAGTYSVTVASDCFIATDTIVVGTPGTPHVALPADTLLCKGKKLWLRNADQPGMYYAWNTGSESCCIEVDSDGVYSLTVSNICGVAVSDEVKVTYSGCENCVLAPSAFTPNGDGLNDAYTPLVNCRLKSYVLKIFNRWGQRVFESYVPGEGWDGTVNGAKADNGVYFYYLRAVPALDQAPKTEMKGDITLLR